MMIIMDDIVFLRRLSPLPRSSMKIRLFFAAWLLLPCLINVTAQTPAPKPTTQSTSSPDQKATIVDDSKPVIVNTDLITFTVTVTDSYGRYIKGLNKNAFTVSDDEQEQKIIFFSDEDAPVSLGVVFDISGSMGGDKISHAKEALSHFIDTSLEMDEYFLIGFNSRAELLLDRTRNSDALLSKLTFIETKGNTALYDATYLGVEKVTHGVHDKRAVILISDGQDNNSRYTFNEVRRLLKETNVIVYSVGILGSGDSSSTYGLGGQSILEELSSVSGGKAFFPNTTAEMNDTFERIALELRHQYSIGYKPEEFTGDGKWHKLKVKVKPPRGLPRLFVRTRDGYFAIAKPSVARPR